MLDAARAQQPAAARLPVTVKGKRIKTIDVHAHCLFREAVDLMGADARNIVQSVRGFDKQYIVVEERLKAMDEHGIDMEVLSINPFWYRRDRDTRRQDRADQQREARRAVRVAAGSLRRLRARSRCSSPTSPCSSSRTR